MTLMDAWSVSSSTSWVGPGTGPVRDDWLHVEEELIGAHLQDAVDLVFGLTKAVPVDSPGTILTQTHIPGAARNDLVGEPFTMIAGCVLVALIGSTGKAPQHEPDIPTPAPRTSPHATRILREFGVT